MYDTLRKQLEDVNHANNLMIGSIIEMKVIVQLLIEKGIITPVEMQTVAEEIIGTQLKPVDETNQTIQTKEYKVLPNGQRIYSDEEGYSNLDGYPSYLETVDAGQE